MAISNGMDCINCETDEARRDSHFCSKKCEHEFMVDVVGPVTCNDCDAEHETVADAESAGWKSLEPDPEGATWNYRGDCPACQKVEA